MTKQVYQPWSRWRDSNPRSHVPKTRAVDRAGPHLVKERKAVGCQPRILSLDLFILASSGHLLYRWRVPRLYQSSCVVELRDFPLCAHTISLIRYWLELKKGKFSLSHFLYILYHSFYTFSNYYYL